MNYYAFEGIDTLGKSTQIKLLQELPNSYFKFQPIFVKEPGETTLGIKLRELILNEEMSKKARMFLFLADRAELFSKIDFTKEFIIADRSLFSHLAYEVDSDYKQLLDFNLFATNNVLPNHIIFFKGSKELLESRLNNKSLDKIEQKGVEYFLKVQENYEAIFKALNLKVFTIDASLSIDKINTMIKEYINDTCN
ncbi:MULTISPECIES: dTMP kinase [unclassified Campylobacter]|uniref:dTMP kinase n=1 Tax=unclassified Campylobacter TaxID=2593542 RepID=UPI001BD9D552|nr:MULTISPECIES: dTMP kinase [unclassified Campylobacter]MBZ7976039.1 dTMP kinase [Campylobacter sp. RM12637]MBZ7977871.1 dTMP kinase [Campylobacter sp. RM12654]MBZ7979840.1 dTMP kinase [Campylobacter sp. RM12642]MBZ7983488.1 dTMP kinase [Campylobacter sp. RM12647]MBZ8007435.1 dTMP kinase [Campylobacter sp. RM9334]